MPLVKRVAGNLHGIGLVSFNFTKRVIVKVLDQLRVYETDEEPGIGKPMGHWFVVAAGVLHDDPCVTFKGTDIPDQVIDLVRCVPYLMRA